MLIYMSMCVSGWANVQGQINRPRARIGRAIGWQRKYTWRIADNMYNVCDQAIAGKQKNTLKNRDIIYISKEPPKEKSTEKQHSGRCMMDRNIEVKKDR